MAELALLVSVLVMGAHGVYRRRQDEHGFNPNFDPHSSSWNPVNLPKVEPYRGEPHDVVWDDLNQGVPMAQPNTSIIMNRPPQIWLPKTEVETEAVKWQRDALYPDDSKGYITDRSRNQAILYDSSRKNYEFGSYHQPVLAQNKTRQEVAQSEQLSGRIYNAYTTGGTSKNGALINIKDPSVGIVRQRADHINDDRSRYQVWTKRQFPELIGDTIQEALPTRAAISHPQEWMQSAKVRAQPRYLNVAHNQHGWSGLQARDNRGEIMDIDSIKKKKLLLIGEQGFTSSQTSHHYGGNLDSSTLQYTGGTQSSSGGRSGSTRKREIIPEISNSGLFQAGTGRTFLDANTGQNGEGVQVRARDILVPSMTVIPHIIGENMTEINTTTPWLSYDPTNDHVFFPRGDFSMWQMQGQPTYQIDGAHALEVPLLR